MNAQDLTKALAGRWHGGYGAARCPAHEDKTPSLSIRDGEDGRLLTFCHARCSAETVWAALQDRGLVVRAECRSAPRRRAPRSHPSSGSSQNQDHALDFWRAARVPIGTVTATYLHHRAITIAIPATIRDHLGLRHGPTGQNFPAMVVAITGSDRKVIAIQRTFLRCDGRGKANVDQPKLSLGPMRDGAVRLGPAGPVLGIAEGIETGLSAMQLFDVPVWCSLSAVRLDRTSGAREIHIFADNGTAGHEAAERAAATYQGQSRRVVLKFPPEQFGDFNDLLRTEAAA